MALTTRDGWVQANANGLYLPMGKAAATSEAANIGHCFVLAGSNAGGPGAVTIGTPGTNGANVAGFGTAGFPQFANAVNPAKNYLNAFEIASAQVTYVDLIDILWWNTGINVTTLTEQTFTQPALPARDALGATNGLGVLAGILVTTDTTNAGAVTNTTWKYTNSGGTADRTATLASFPATARAGSIVPLPFAAGDVGCRKIQSVTLGTSYGGGAISLICYRVLARVYCPVANMLYRLGFGDIGCVLYNDAALALVQNATGTTAGALSGGIRVIQG